MLCKPISQSKIAKVAYLKSWTNRCTKSIYMTAATPEECAVRISAYLGTLLPNRLG